MRIPAYHLLLLQMSHGAAPLNVDFRLARVLSMLWNCLACSHACSVLGPSRWHGPSTGGCLIAIVLCAAYTFRANLSIPSDYLPEGYKSIFPTRRGPVVTRLLDILQKGESTARILSSEAPRSQLIGPE